MDWGGDLMVAHLRSDSIITFQNHLPNLGDGAKVNADTITEDVIVSIQHWNGSGERWN